MGTHRAFSASQATPSSSELPGSRETGAAARPSVEHRVLRRARSTRCKSVPFTESTDTETAAGSPLVTCAAQDILKTEETPRCARADQNQGLVCGGWTAGVEDSRHSSSACRRDADRFLSGERESCSATVKWRYATIHYWYR